MFHKDVEEDARRLVKIATDAADLLDKDNDEIVEYVTQNFPEKSHLIEEMAKGPPTINFVYPEFPEFQFWCRSGPPGVHVKGRSKYFGFMMTISSKNPEDWTSWWDNFIAAKATRKARKLPGRLKILFGVTDVSGML
tara:strand:+ start:9848 stop:10258 length:411 start_codon:yes stop_codon:yes gene_type:complete